MNRQDPLIVPKGIKYLTEWPEFTLPDHPAIIDKQLTGCGFTEYVICNPTFNAVLISPRKMLLENKVAQHNPKSLIDGTEISEQRVIYYARTDSPDLGIDKDLMSTKPKVDKDIESIDKFIDPAQFKRDLRNAISMFLLQKRPIKLAVTYDSLGKVIEVIKDLGMLDQFYYVVDEFQSIFTDSRFKPGTELELVTYLQGLQRVSFVSATPMMEDYLDMVDEFKTLPYYVIDWEAKDKSRIIHPEIVAKPTRNINETAKKIITDFKNKKFPVKTLVDEQGIPVKVVESTEIILYINSVKNICDIIRQNKLMPEDVNVICARTEDNSKKVREAFRLVFKDAERDTKELPKVNEIIGSVPVPDLSTGIVYNKPITLCTKTVYLGADFYSDCARSIVLSDASSECLAVDITLDLPQILGRQRNYSNPWKNSLEIWFKAGFGAKEISKEEFKKILERKTNKTNNLLLSYNTTPTLDAKHDLATEYRKIAKTENYKDHYVAVNEHAGNDLKPQFNNLVKVAELRAFDIQQQDYKDRFTVFNRISEVFGEGTTDISLELQSLEDEINTYTRFPQKMEIVCNWIENKGEGYINFLPEPYRTYIQALGIDYILARGCRKFSLDEAMVSIGIGRILGRDDIDEAVTGYFQIGSRYTYQFIKSTLQEMYTNLGIPDTAKAKDLEKWFEVKVVKITNKETKKRDFGFEILKIK